MSSNSPSTTHFHKPHRPFTGAPPSSPVKPRPPATDLTTIQRQLLRVVSEESTPAGATARFIQLALNLTNAEHAAYFATAEEGCCRLLTERSSPNKTEETTLTQVGDLAAKVIEADAPKISRRQHAVVVGVPVAADVDRTDAITAVFSFGYGEVEPFVVSLQLVAAYATLWWQQQEKRQVDFEADMASGIVEIVAAIEQSRDLSSACVVAANRLHQLLHADQVAIGLHRRNKSSIELQAISERAEIDAKSEAGRLLVNAMNESLIHEQPTAWPPIDTEKRAALLAHQKLKERSSTSSAISVPLRLDDEELVGAITILSSSAADIRPLTQCIQTAAPFLASAIQTAKRLEGGPLRSSLRRLAIFSMSRVRKLMTMTAIAAIVSLAPVRHKISCDCEVQASARRFAVAPYAGILQETFVRPGDLVSKDQLLATMDDREITWELSGLNAERDRASKEHDIALSNNEAAKMQMAALEVERNELQIRLLEHRRANLHVRAAESGVVLQGDLDGARGAPVETGQALFEIAPLDQLRLDIRIPEDDVTYVGEGQRVVLHLDSLPKARLEGVVARIHPQAQVIDAENVFTAEVELTEIIDELRPGMHGSAQVIESRRPLAWVLFHHSWERLLNYLR